MLLSACVTGRATTDTERIKARIRKMLTLGLRQARGGGGGGEGGLG